ncbi:MAG TPA: NHL repeat-containing protein [Candidatus Acidoferrales bacterium]|nr:NHL repeat-containing protein [Candidatus Acidoferrales bacterium]
MNPRRAHLVAALVAAAALVACHSSSGSGGSTPPTTAPGRASTLYLSGAQVPGYLVSLIAASNGSAAPLTAIRSTYANFAYTYLLAYHSGSLWATSCLGLANTAGPVLAFSATANGPSVTPSVAIAGAATGLSGCQLGIAVDSSQNVYVADPTSTATFPGGQIAVFGSGQQGNVAPIRRIFGTAANLHSPAGLALDGSGNLFVANSGEGSAGYAGAIEIFSTGANGNAVPGGTIIGGSTGLSEPFGVAFDSLGNLYVTNVAADSITVYAPGARGNATPIRTISGSNTQLNSPTGIAVDGAGYVYVGNESQPNSPVLVFAPSSNGNASPVQAITVNAGGFDEPSGVALK